MKKMTKGAIVTGLGVALLLGGGGTLAVWNAEAESTPGIVTAGNLDLQAVDNAVWTSSLTGEISNIQDYRIIPGETLTFSQDLTITLEGNSKLAANLAVTDKTLSDGFDQGTITGGDVILKKGNDVINPETPLKGTQTVTASTTLAFDAENQAGVKDEYALSKIGYQLKQVDPNTQG